MLLSVIWKEAKSSIECNIQYFGKYKYGSDLDRKCLATFRQKNMEDMDAPVTVMLSVIILIPKKLYLTTSIEASWFILVDAEANVTEFC